MSNPKMGPNETITGLELLMKLSPKDRKKLISKLLNGELPIDRGSKTQQEHPTTLLWDPSADHEDGPYETYYKNGQLERRGTYVAGKEDGPYENYHDNGELEQKGTYVAGERHGPWEFCNSNGELDMEGTYNMDGECGEWIEYGETVTYPPCPPGPEDGN